MYLIDWFQANSLMAFTAIVLFGIPIVVLIIVFTKKTKGKSDAGSED